MAIASSRGTVRRSVVQHIQPSREGGRPVDIAHGGLKLEGCWLRVYVPQPKVIVSLLIVVLGPCPAQNVLFLRNDNENLTSAGKPRIRFGDIYQSASRTPTSPEEDPFNSTGRG